MRKCFKRVLCIMQILMILPVYPVLATNETVTDFTGWSGSETELLSALSIEETQRLDFTADFDAASNECTPADNATIVYHDEDGLRLSAGDSSLTWNWKNNTENWTPLSKKMAVMITYRLNQNNTDYLYTEMPYSENRMGVFALKPQGTYTCSRYDVTEEGSDTGVQSWDLWEGSLTYNTWVDYLIVSQGRSQLYFRRYYNESDSNSWVYAFASYGGLQKTNDGLTFTMDPGNEAYIKRIVVYDEITDIAMPSETQRQIFGEDFTGTTIDFPANAEIQGGTLSGNSLSLTSGADARSSYRVQGLEIPVGGYAEFRHRADSNTIVTLQDGKKKYTMELTSMGGIAGSGTEAEVEIAGRTPWHIYRVLRYENGNYGCYRRTEKENVWQEVSQSLTGETDRSVTAFQIEQAENGQGYLDYLRIYGPGDEKSLVLTDGYTTTMAKPDEFLNYPAGLHVWLPYASFKRCLVFAGYDKTDSLIMTKVETIAPGREKYVFDATVNLDVETVRIFLWKDMKNTTPLAETQTALVNVQRWCDVGWELGGTASVDKVNDAVLLNASSGSDASLTRTGELGENYDVSWNMQIDSFVGQESVFIYNGDERVSLFICPDGIGYQTESSITEQGYEIKKIDYEIGNTSHTYRALRQEGSISLFIDGNELGVIKGERNSSLPQIAFYTRGDNQEARMMVSDVSAELLTEREEKQTPENFSYDFYGSWVEDYSNLQRVSGWSIGSGKLQGTSPDSTYHATIHKMENFGEDFVFEARLQFPHHGESSGFNIRWDRATMIRIFEDFILANNNQSDAIDLSDPDAWHDFKFETYQMGNRCRIYLDGEEVMDFRPGINTGDQYLYIYVHGYGQSPEATAKMNVDSMSFTPITYPIKISSLIDGVKYREGQSISLGAKVEDTETIPYVDYKVNGQIVARGTAPDYRATIKGIQSGTLELTAEYGEMTSGITVLEVLPEIKGEISVEEQDNKIVVSVENLQDELNRVSEIECLVDGVSVAKDAEAPFEITLDNLTNEGHTISAIFRDKVGMVLHKATASWIPQIKNEDTTVNYSNEISYSVLGESGDALIQVSNGSHILSLRHTAEEVLYQSAEGEKSYPIGVGDFRILTDGPYADVYIEGQLALSYLMPRTSTVEKTVNQNGLSVDSFFVSIPENRRNHLIRRSVSLGTETYSLPALDTYHNLDFVADMGDEGDILVNDGIYLTKLTLKNGKIYTWTTHEEADEPYQVEIATLPVDGKAYYRVDTSAGMSRIYADGKWLYSFRSVLATGEPRAWINLTAGDGLELLSVNDYTDLYLYYDDFKGKGALDSLDYWRLSKNMQASVDTETGTMNLTTSGVRAIAELNAFAGNLDFSADVTINSCDGFWLMVNHNLTQWYNKIGYNAQTGMFEIQEIRSDNHTTPTKINVIKEVPGNLPLGKALHMELKTQIMDTGKEILLLVDGEPMISGVISQMHTGMTGFMVNNGSIAVSNVSYRGDAKPMVSMTDTSQAYSTNTMDMFENGDALYLVNDNANAKTTVDGGKTWKEVAIGGNGGMISRNVVEMDNGELLSLKRTRVDDNAQGHKQYVNIAYVSTDKGASWTQVGQVQESGYYDRDQMAGRSSQGKSGRVYFVSAELSNENYGLSRVYYSDDYGRTWTASKTDISGWTEGYAIQEVTVHELSSGIVRLTLRTDKGYLVHWESKNRGETFETTPITTPFFTALNCFGMEQDPQDPDTFYTAWGYDNANLAGQKQTPRLRISAARSTDGGLTWEYLGTLHENNSTESINTMMNMNINVGKNYVVMNVSSMAEIETKNEGGRYIVFDKEKQVATKRFERLHLRYPQEPSRLKVVSKQDMEQSLVAYPAKNRILVKGTLVNEAVYGECIDIRYLAGWVYGTVEENTDGSVTIRQGENAVTFETESLTKYDGRLFLDLTTFANAYQFTVTKYNDIVIIGRDDNWSTRQRRAFRLAMDPFATEM